MDEFEVRQRRRALLNDPRIEVGPHRPVGAVILRTESPPLAIVGGGKAREGRRKRRPLHLEWVAGDNADEGGATCHKCRKAQDVVFDNDIWLHPRDDVAQLRLAVHRAVDERLPGRLDEALELLDRRLAELRRGVADEVLPELTGIRLRLAGRDLGCGSEIDEILLEPQQRELALPRGLRREHDAVAPFEQYLADADALIRRAVGRFGHEQDGQLSTGHQVSLARGWAVASRA